MDVPEPTYARTRDGAYIACQVVGDGPLDIAWQLDLATGLELGWEHPLEGAFFEELASFARLILHDRRGFGLSSRTAVPPNLETRAFDLRAVLDAAGATRALLGGDGESLAPGLLVASSDPARVRGVVWNAPRPRTTWTPDYPWGWDPARLADELAVFTSWGTADYGRRWAARLESLQGIRPSEDDVRAVVKASREACTPDVIRETAQIWWQTDVRAILPAVTVPALLLVDDADTGGRGIADMVAARMPRATVQELRRPSSPSGVREHLRPRLDAVRRFVGVEPDQAAATILSTVLFTDIVGSTRLQARLGDRGWKTLVERHHATVRQALRDWDGFENDTAGDGFYATFRGPVQAIRCALQICEHVRPLGIEVRAGVHTGRCEIVESKCAGITVTTGARIAALAQPSQVLVSQTVRDLAPGSGLGFEPVGEHALKGIHDPVPLFRAVATDRDGWSSRAPVSAG